MPPEFDDEPGKRRRKRAPAGRCGLDGQLAHAGYHCGAHFSAEVSPAALGMTPLEVEWCRAHPAQTTVQRLFGLYRRVERDPRAGLPRGQFARELAAWREKRRSSGVSRLSGT
jgi:hypothetical protein